MWVNERKWARSLTYCLEMLHTKFLRPCFRIAWNLQYIAWRMKPVLPKIVIAIVPASKMDLIWLSSEWDRQTYRQMDTTTLVLYRMIYVDNTGHWYLMMEFEGLPKISLVDPPLVISDQVGHLYKITKRPAEMNCWWLWKYHTELNPTSGGLLRFMHRGGGA